MNTTVTQVKGLLPNMNAKNKDGSKKVYSEKYKGLLFLDLEITDGGQTIMTIQDVPFWVRPDNDDPSKLYAGYKFPERERNEYAPVVKIEGLRETATRLLQTYWPAIVACTAPVVAAPNSQLIRLCRVNEPVTATTSGPVGNN